MLGMGWMNRQGLEWAAGVAVWLLVEVPTTGLSLLPLQPRLELQLLQQLELPGRVPSAPRSRSKLQASRN
nr:hypothetical protein BaRGS_027048 [Batillaria attramentaria]